MFKAGAFALLLVLLLMAAFLSCGALEGKPNTSAPGGIDNPDELLRACSERDREIDEWKRREERKLEDDFIEEGKSVWQIAARLDQIDRDARAMSRELSDNCQAKVRDLLPPSSESSSSESERRRPFPTVTSPRARRAATVSISRRQPTATFAPRPTRTSVPTLASTPVPTSIPTPGVVPTERPLTASFLYVPASHNGRDPIQFQLLFTEPVSTSYKILRDIAIQVENGTVLESKRVNKRSDMWMITIEPEGNRDVVITLTAPAGCGHAASVCTKGGKALANNSAVSVLYRE